MNELRIYHGTRFTTVQQVYAGELCAVTGFTQVHPGDRIGEKMFSPGLSLSSDAGRQGDCSKRSAAENSVGKLKAAGR